MRKQACLIEALIFKRPQHLVRVGQKNYNHLQQGSPTPGLWTGISPLPVRNRAAQQEVSSRQASKASSTAPHRAPSLPIAPHRSPSLALPPEPSPTPCPWKNCLPRNQSLVPKRLGTADFQHQGFPRSGTTVVSGKVVTVETA